MQTVFFSLDISALRHWCLWQCSLPPKS